MRVLPPRPWRMSQQDDILPQTWPLETMAKRRPARFTPPRVHGSVARADTRTAEDGATGEGGAAVERAQRARSFLLRSHVIARPSWRCSFAPNSSGRARPDVRTTCHVRWTLEFHRFRGHPRKRAPSPSRQLEAVGAIRASTFRPNATNQDRATDTANATEPPVREP